MSKKDKKSSKVNKTKHEMISYQLYQHNINSFTECLLNNYSKLDTFIRPILITLVVSKPDDFAVGGGWFTHLFY